MSRIEDYQAFTAIVEKQSLTAAAGHLGRSLQAVSRSLAVLERDLGVELVRRTTRRSNPTDAGLAFYQRLSAALAEIDAAKVATSNRRVEATGVLRIAGSTGFTPLYVVPALPEFLAAHPGVEVELELSDRYIDLVGEGFDLAIRVGQMPDSDAQGEASGGFAPRRLRSRRATSPSTAIRATRRISRATNASSAPRPAMATRGRSR